MKARPEVETADDAREFVAGVRRALMDSRNAMRLPDMELVDMAEFRIQRPEVRLSVAEKELIVDQAIVLFESLYAHLRFKQQRNASFQPVPELRRRRAELSHMGDLQFHSTMILLFSGARDPHTLYSAPRPWGEAVAFLPFSVRMWRDTTGESRLVVARMLNGFDHPHFDRGSEILNWNGKPALEYILDNPGRLPAIETATAIARGLATSTIVPLAHCLMPAEDIVELEYTSVGVKEVRRIHIPWLVATNMGQRQDFPDDAFSVSMASGFAIDVARLFQHGEAEFDPSQASGAKTMFFAGIPTTGPFEVQFSDGPGSGAISPNLLRDRLNRDAKFGYVRIRHFGDATSDAAQRVREFAAILDKMNEVAPDGLVIDLRGNPGGNVRAAESMLQLLTDKRIQPIQFHLANTKGIRRTLQRAIRRQPTDGAELARLTNLRRAIGPWMDSYPLWSKSKEWVSSGHSITTEDEANTTGRVYQGRSVLLLDALSYSAADIFAAGYQDHGIGRVIGVDPGSGGGGGNVWYQRDIVRFLEASADLPLAPLPEGVGMSVAMRRACRTGPQQELEDIGVRPDVVYKPESPEEAMEGFDKLVNLACSFANDKREFRIRVRSKGFKDEDFSFVVLETRNVERVDVYNLFGNRVASVPVMDGERTRIEIAGAPGRDFEELVIEGLGLVGGWRTTVCMLWEVFITRDDA